MAWSAVRIVINTQAIPDDQEPVPVEEAPVLAMVETPLADESSAFSSPWPYEPWSKHPKGRSVEKHYRTLSMQDIKSLPVGQLAAKDSVLFLWTTGPFLREAQAVIEAWGFEHKTLGFNWVKTREGTGGLHMGTGYHTRANAELCLLATKGRGLPRVRRDVRQVVVSPVGRHSEKPQEVHHRIEELYGPQRRIELFARRQVPGWDAVGDEIDGQDIRKVLVGA